jgi:molybdenum cofactor cytidylyltransferase
LEFALPRVLELSGSVVVTGPPTDAGSKWSALDPEQLEVVHRWAIDFDAHMLIEADGARGRSIKAPADHEPVIPEFVDLVVPVVGADALGAAVLSDKVHRPELIRRVLELAESDRLSAEHIGKLISSDEGGLRAVPPDAEVRPLINKIEMREDDGEAIARYALESESIGAVLLGEVQSDQPIRTVIGRVAGIVLAAGGSSRLGQPKQVITWRGRPLVRHVVDVAVKRGLDPVVVVTGAYADQVERSLSEIEVVLAHNSDWETGQSASVRSGIEALPDHIEAVVFLLADMPLVPHELIGDILQTHQRTLSPIVAPRAGDRRANPVLFDRETFEALLTLEGDQGGRSLFDHFEVEWVVWDDEILLDIDTASDLEQLRALE